MSNSGEAGGRARENSSVKVDTSPGPKDGIAPRNTTSKVSIKLPFKSESLRGQSLLARFHNSIKSENGPKTESKPTNGTLRYLMRIGGSAKSGHSFEGVDSFHAKRGITSASLPDDLDQNIDVGECPSCSKDDLNTSPKICISQEIKAEPDSACLSLEEAVSQPNTNGSQKDNWFGTWPGRPRKLKALRKKISGRGIDLKNITENENIIGSSESPGVGETSVESTCGEVSIGDGCSKGCGGPSDGAMSGGGVASVSLDALLESLPLVYDPTTKQLCLSQSRSVQKDALNRKMGKYIYSQHDSSNENTYVKVTCGDESRPNHVINDNMCDTSATPKALEMIQEVDESGENTCLVDNYPSPHSGNVSGSSSLERGCFESPRNSLQRVGTNNSLSITDASSFSSLSSSNTELSGYSGTDSAVCLQSDTGSLKDFSFTESDVKTKKRGITDFLSRNLFSWRHKDAGDAASPPCSDSPPPTSSLGWKIFTRPPRSPDLKGRNCEVEAGSAGLIMENRPSSLPAKTALEALKHRQEYQAMVSAAKKKELREAKERKKAQASQQKLEQQMAAAVDVWNMEILPKWDTMRTHKKCRELWWLGLPSCVRGKVWKLAIGNELNITPQLYNIMVQRSVDKLLSLSECGSMASQEDVIEDAGDQEETIDLIHLDVSRTFPHLCIFQKGGPYHDTLHNILGAYVCLRPDVGYVQGMSFLAATLLLNMHETDAFIAFSNMLNRQAHMAFFRVDQGVMCAYYKTFEELLEANLPQLAEHLHAMEVTPDLYVLDWLLTVFVRPLPLDAAVRIWDVYLRDGEEFLIRAALGTLKLYESTLLGLECTVTAAQFLTRLPDDLCAESLFRAIASVRTSAHKRSFSQILQANMDSIVSV